MLRPGDELQHRGSARHRLQAASRHGRISWCWGGASGLATLAPLSQLAAEAGVGVTAILSARHPDVVMSRDLFEGLGARTITVLDSDGSSAVENVERFSRA